MTVEKTAFPVLIVEDDEPTRKLLHAVLTRGGFPTGFAANGGEAIRLLRTNNDYAAIVLDIMMPEVGGREVVEFITAESIPIPVVICSAAGPRVLKGFDPNVVKGIIRKPFDIEEFVALVTSVARSSP